jgi:hypothetical protein
VGSRPGPADQGADSRPEPGPAAEVTAGSRSARAGAAAARVGIRPVVGGSGDSRRAPAVAGDIRLARAVGVRADTRSAAAVGPAGIRPAPAAAADRGSPAERARPWVGPWARGEASDARRARDPSQASPSAASSVRVRVRTELGSAAAGAPCDCRPVARWPVGTGAPEIQQEARPVTRPADRSRTSLPRSSRPCWDAAAVSADPDHTPDKNRTDPGPVNRTADTSGHRRDWPPS